MVNTKCEECNKEFLTHKCWIKRGDGRFCSKKCYGVWRSRTIRGENHHQFMPNTKNYFSVHDWMIKNFGVASKCENKKCINKSKRFVWAKKHGKEYERKKENFKQLCYKCHFKYDFNEFWHENMIIGQRKRRGII